MYQKSDSDSWLRILLKFIWGGALIIYKIMDCSSSRQARPQISPGGANAVSSGSLAMLLQPYPAALLCLPGSTGHLQKLFVFFLLRVAAGQLEISHGGLTVPNMLAKPASLFHRWEGN